MIKTLLKIFFSLGIIYWLAHSGKIDLTLISQSLKSGPQWIFALMLLFTQFNLANFRYKILLESKKNNSIPYFKLVPINWIGLFFSSVLPGAVTGDIIKMVYVKKLDSSFTKTFLVTSALIDRILGLCALLFLAGVFSLIYYSEIIQISPKMNSIIMVNFLLFLASVLGFMVLFSPRKFQHWIQKIVYKIPKIGHRVQSIIEQIFFWKSFKKELLQGFLISIVAQFCSIIAFWVITSPFYTGHLPLPYVFTFIPIGLITIAIPISPAGLGVGHAVFQNLFALVQINNGASLFNLFFLCALSLNLIGIIPYLLLSEKSK